VETKPKMQFFSGILHTAYRKVLLQTNDTMESIHCKGVPLDVITPLP